jgi:hypothetical protein
VAIDRRNCNAWKGHEIVACGVLHEKSAVRPVNRRRMSAILFFVRVNQVLVRLWARAMEADAYPCSSRCPVDV